MGLDWKQTTTYRFVGQSEVDVLLSNNKVESKRGMADAGIDVTSSPKVTTAATGEYRVTFKESFDKNNGLGKVRKKNEEDSNLERGRGYDINDVVKIERLDENGNVVEVIYDSESLLSNEQPISTTQSGSSPASSDVESTAKALEGLVNQIPTAELRRPNGSIGTQGFVPENLVDVARFIAKEMGFEIPAFNKDLGTSEIKQVIEYLKK
jgi:hypothetical protein